MKSSQRLFPVVFALGLLAAPATAWDRTGHLVVARIAWDRMTPAARATAAELLVAAPRDSDLHQLRSEGTPLAQRQRRHFQFAAHWPDFVRDESHPERHAKYHHGDWHWINHFFEQVDGVSREMTELEPRGLVVERLGELVTALGDRSRPASDRAIDLAWVLHLGGDVHQPLHATARVTPTEPEGDRGGNLFELDRGGNLHAFWDGILRSSSIWWIFQSEDTYVAGIARSIVSEHPPSSFGARASGRDFSAWARESFEISMAEVYPPDLERGRQPSEAYERRAEEIARERIALAGYRLATVLNEVLGGS